MKKAFKATLAAVMFAGSLSAATVYATVNGENVTEEDIASMMGQMPGSPDFAKMTPDIQKKVVEQLVERKLLVQNALNSGIEKTDDFKEALSQVKEDLALRVWMKRQMDAISVSTKDVKAFYQANLDKLSESEKVQARHILVKTEEEAKKIISDLSKVKQAELDAKFADAAKEHSTGPSGKRGGDLGYFDRKQMVKPFSDAAFGLKKGEMTKAPVKTNFGWHVIYVVDKKEASTVPFEQVQGQMEEGAKMEKFKAQVEAKVKALTGEAKITYKK